jgi:hypothetical protein
MSSHTIPPVADPDAARRQLVLRALRDRRRRAVIGTIAARYSDRPAPRRWQ